MRVHSALFSSSGGVVNSVAPWHCLSPLAAFTSGAYFLQNGRRWQWICEVYTANFKGYFEGLLSECVWQQATTCCSCYRMPTTAFFPHKLTIFWSTEKLCKDTFFHPPSPFPCNFCNCNSGGICTVWQFWVKLLLLYRAWTNAYSEISPETTAATFHDSLHEILWKPALLNHQIHTVPARKLSQVNWLIHKGKERISFKTIPELLEFLFQNLTVESDEAVTMFNAGICSAGICSFWSYKADATVTEAVWPFSTAVFLYYT